MDSFIYAPVLVPALQDLLPRDCDTLAEAPVANAWLPLVEMVPPPSPISPAPAMTPSRQAAALVCRFAVLTPASLGFRDRQNHVDIVRIVCRIFARCNDRVAIRQSVHSPSKPRRRLKHSMGGCLRTLT